MYLSGTYDRNLDAKGRLSLPPAFKKELPESVRVLPAPEKEVDALYVFTEDTFKAWLESVFTKDGGYDPTNRVHRLVRSGLNGDATTLEIDSAGRISLPESHRSKVQLGREVTVVGDEDHLTIWDREAYLAHRTDTQDAMSSYFG